MGELQTIKLGRERDKRILELIETGGPFIREQVQQLIFPQHKGPQTCIRRLTKLVQRGKLKRVRFGAEQQYIYYAGQWSRKSEHAVMVNWVYTAIVTQRKSWYKLKAFTREYACMWEDNRLVADALVVLENTAKHTLKPVFIECDRDSGNGFDKVERYTEYYLSRAWTGQFWAKKDAEGYFTFPRILVVSERPVRVQRAIEKGNTEGLRFTVATLEQVKKDIYAYL